MASSKTCLMVALCSLVILITVFDSAQSASCCLRYAKRQPRCKQILGYTVQTINNACDINAIIFHTQGRFVCADPSKPLTRIVMKCVDKMRSKAKNMENSDKKASG